MSNPYSVREDAAKQCYEEGLTFVHLAEILQDRTKDMVYLNVLTTAQCAMRNFPDNKFLDYDESIIVGSIITSRVVCLKL